MEEGEEGRERGDGGRLEDGVLMIHGVHDNYHHVTHCVHEQSHLQTLEKGERMKREGITETKFLLGNEVGQRDKPLNNSTYRGVWRVAHQYLQVHVGGEGGGDERGIVRELGQHGLTQHRLPIHRR